MSGIACALLALCTQSLDLPESLMWPAGAQAEIFHTSSRNGYAEAALMGRKSTIEGRWLAEGTGLGFKNYDDIFQEGSGIRGELTGMADYVDAWVGGYVAVGLDTYEGDSATSQGVRISVDDLEVIGGFFGMKGLLSLKKVVSLGGYVGAGPVFYNDVDARLNGVSGNLFQDAWDWAVEAGVRVNVKLGPLILEGGLDFRYMGDLHQGHSSPTFTGLAEPQEIRSIGFLLGAGIAF